MKLKKEFLDKVKSEQEFNYIIDNRLCKLTVEPLDNNYKLILQYSSSNIKNKLLNTSIAPLAILNEKNEIAYLPSYSSYRVQNTLGSIVEYQNPEKCLDEISNFRTEMSNLQSSITNELYEVLMKKLPLLDKQIIESVDLEKYREKAIEKYKRKEEIHFPISKNNITITQDLLVYYLTDKEKMKNNILDCISDAYLNYYEQYIAEKECIRQYVEFIETNPDFKRQSDICAIIDGDKQSYAINYHDQRGNKLKHSFKKNISRMEALNKTVLDYQVLDKIPIELIDTITWRNNVLFDSKNYSNTKISEEETAVKLALLEKFNEINPKYFDDKKTMYKILMANTKAFKYMSPRLQTDINFIIKIMKDIKMEESEFIKKCHSYDLAYSLKYMQTKKNIYSQLSPTMKKDKTLLVEYIKMMDDKEYGSQFSTSCYAGTTGFAKDFEDALSLYVSSYEFSKLLIEKVGYNDEIINMIPREFLNRQEMLELLKQKRTIKRTPCSAYKHLITIDNLKFLYNEDEIKRNLCSLSDEILSNKTFVLDNLTDYALLTDRIFNLYKYDKDVMDKLLVSVTFENYCQKYLDYNGISNKDSLKMFELCSKNISFVSKLTDDDKKIFIDGELSEVEKIFVNSDNSIHIKTPNCTFKLQAKNYISLVDNNNPKLTATIYNYTVPGQYLENKILEVLQSNFKLRSKLYESVISEVINNNKKEIEPER